MSKIPDAEKLKIYDDAAILYGKEMQMIVAIEEMAELVKVLCKALRGNLNKANLAEEAADAEIVVEQVKRMHGIENCVEEYKDTKIKRLNERLERDYKESAYG